MTPATQAYKRTNGVKATAKIIVVDDHPIVRHGLVELIRRDESLEVCGEADNAAATLEMVRMLSPDLVTLDLSLAGPTSGMDLLAELAANHRDVKVLVI